MSKTNLPTFDGNAAIRELADALKRDVAIEADKKVTVLPKDRYESMLPEGLDLKTVKKLQEFNGKLPAALELAAGELAVPYFKKHKDADTLVMRLPVARDSLQVVVHRDTDVRNVSTGEVSQVYGRTRSKWRMNGTNGASGQLRVVRDYVQALATSSLKV